MKMNKLFLNKQIFGLNSIENAKAAFNGICEVIITENDKYFVCSFKKCRYDIDETVKEFENYIVDLMNVNSYDN